MNPCKSVKSTDEKSLRSAYVVTVARNFLTRPATVFTPSRNIDLRPDDPSGTLGDQTEYLFKQPIKHSYAPPVTSIMLPIKI